MAFYILNLILIPTDKCNYQPSSKKLFFPANGEQHRKAQLEKMQRSKDHGKSNLMDTPTSQILHLWLRKHHRRGGGKIKTVRIKGGLCRYPGKENKPQRELKLCSGCLHQPGTRHLKSLTSGNLFQANLKSENGGGRFPSVV